MAKAKSTEVAVSAGAGQLMDAGLAAMFDVKDNMEGVTPEFPGIKIIHQGQMFEMPDGTKVEDFSGIIIDIARANAWWSESFDSSGGGTPPDCFSMDGILPSHDSEDMQAEDCAVCPQNKYGSADDGEGKGKACKNMKRLFILVPGETFPFKLTAPPTNLKPIDRYVTQLSSKNAPYQLIRTTFGLVKQKNKDGIEYSELTFDAAGAVDTQEEAAAIAQTVKDLKASMRGLAINSEEM